MGFSIDIDLSELRAECEQADLVMQLGVSVAVETGKDAAVEWAKTQHTYKDQTGELTSSIHKTADGIEASADHASYVEYDTAPHPIDPVNAKVLHWVRDGEHHFAKHVNHPGTTAQPFMQPAADEAERVITRELETTLGEQLQSVFGK